MPPIRGLTISVGAGLLLFATACNGGAAAQSNTQAPPATSLPAATVAQTPLPTTAPAATPVPVPTPLPTAVPFVLPTEEPWPDDPKAGLAVKPLPEAIRPGANEIPSEQALAIWTKWLGGSRAVGFGGTLFIDYCSDGTGTWSGLGRTGQDGSAFKWNLTGSANWRDAIAHYNFVDPKDASIIETAIISVFYTEAPIYESPRCK